MRIQGRKKSGKLGCESIENSENCARGIGNSWQQWQWNVLSSPHNLWVTIPRWKTHLCKVKCKTVKGATNSLTCRPVYCSVKQGCRKKVTYSTQNFTRLNKYSNSHSLAVMDNFNYIWPHKFAEAMGIARVLHTLPRGRHWRHAVNPWFGSGMVWWSLLRFGWFWHGCKGATNRVHILFYFDKNWFWKVLVGSDE